MDYFDQNTPLNLTPGLMNRGPGTEQLPHYLQLRQHHLVPLKEGINRTIQGDVTSILDTAGVKVALVSAAPNFAPTSSSSRVISGQEPSWAAMCKLVEKMQLGGGGYRSATFSVASTLTVLDSSNALRPAWSPFLMASNNRFSCGLFSRPRITLMEHPMIGSVGSVGSVGTKLFLPRYGRGGCLPIDQHATAEWPQESANAWPIQSKLICESVQLRGGLTFVHPSSSTSSPQGGPLADARCETATQLDRFAD
eukprot:CAMPEP_0119476388 /NCGR_PEP_ID=MMETSP1344-20130328/6927_1 /TAXON_ID=236787 /ORGANISM="Florenciella parvula, Strain CCMP2471" /LENGTH=251 /DNA_ID=CAMNT_0007510141 /DNA_START=269 /DNA_END=1026 /DNA_ORIENTATION=+